MARPGPRPTPTALLKLRGSNLVTQKREANEVQGPPGAPESPDWLTGAAKAMWDELLPVLEAMRVLTVADRNALARYCKLWARWREAEEFIDSKGSMYPLKDANGNIKYFQQFPQVAISHKLSQQLTRIEQEFGLTPAARSRIQVNQSEGNGNAASKAHFFDAG